MANTSLTVATLDFDTIKQNLKTHMSSQDIFKDYDFEGSNISVLIDLLAYNTSLNAFYMNMLNGESFLDSAQLRSSVISHAKELNYRPRSARSARATIRLSVVQNNNGTLTIPKGTSFTSTYNFKTYTFTTNEVKVFFAPINEDTGDATFQTDDIQIYEGFYVTETFVMNYNNEELRFILSNPMIDTDSLIVNSIEDGGSEIVTYSLSETLLGLNSDSKKFFLQSVDDRYEIVFGDDILGRRPRDGAVINVQYRISSGSMPNGASQFTIDSDITSDSSGRIKLTTISKAIGGDEPESIASIKYNAPRHFQTQERAVTETDYETLLTTEFPEIEAISVYGGETVSPPQYGKVYIALSLSNIDGIPDSKRTQYHNFIKPRMPNPIQPVFVTPTRLYARIDSRVKYNLNTTNLKPDEIRLLVSNEISKYNDENLNDFNTTLYNSRFVRAIDDAHESIVSNETEVHIFKKFIPKIGVTQNIDINFGVSLRDDIPKIANEHTVDEIQTIFSSSFRYKGYSCIIEDDGVSGLRLMRMSNSGLTKIKDIGKIDYAAGTLQLVNFISDGYTGQSVRIYAKPASRDIVSSFNDIFEIDMSEVNINVQAIRI